MSSRPALTMIETLVGLALLAGLVLWWRPLVQLAIAAPQTPDLTFLQAADELQGYVATGTIQEVTSSALTLYQPTVKAPAAPLRRLERIETAQGQFYLQFSAVSPSGRVGYTPVLPGVSQVRFTQVRPGVVRYQLTMLSGRYTGVVLDATTR